MTDTYEGYVNFLRGNLERIRKSLLIERDSEIWNLYEKAFHEKYITRKPAGFSPGIVSATDSSEFVRELYNGKKLILIRAYAKSKDLTESDFLCEVMDVNRDEIRNFTILLMEHTEHVATLRLLEKTSPSYVLMDGSLLGRLRHKRNRIDAEGYEDFMDLYFQRLYQLISVCLEQKLPLVFIAKSSESMIFRRFLLDKIQNEILDDNGKKEESVVRRTDHLLLKSFANESGYTVPLALPYRTDKGVMGTSHVNVVSFHALPDINDLPIKIDLVLPEVQSMELKGPTEFDVDTDLIDMIFWGYGGLKTHNIWLADVDREVKFGHKEVENLYMRTFEKIIEIPFYETRGERRARIRI